ncbi:TIGR03757 family integrating conjugative element protein [Methyloterricola oryzae]|uniref:TIGR03757 family integrating conjugative element protein n=1 Tax=Methyloterricola oryzae TaxID=1495050 RepID=UPI00069A7FD8|nr:TIGR03757 family integrating conjugative element protein [Methyloterricola oryzae]
MTRFLCLARTLITLLLALDSGQNVAAATAELPARMTVITDAKHPLQGLDVVRTRTGIDVQVYDLSAPVSIDAELAAGLPKELEAAAQVARSRLADPQFQARLRSAYQGHLRALQFQITRYPAVLFDHGAAVVYGVTDLPEALSVYLRWKGSSR